MAGVEILDHYTIASDDAFNIWVFLGILAFLILMGIVISAFGDRDFSRIIAFIGLGFLLGGVGGGIAGMYAPPPEHQIIRYEVVIDDNVSMTEFYQEYKVIDQHGKIYIVEER